MHSRSTEGLPFNNYLPPGYLSNGQLRREQDVLQQYRRNFETFQESSSLSFASLIYDDVTGRSASETEENVQPLTREELRFFQIRLGLIKAELNFRQHNHTVRHAKQDSEPSGAALPRNFSVGCYKQLTALRRQQTSSSAAGSDRRIPLPDHPQQLWAHHKYSVMARDPNAYDAYGPFFAQADPSSDGFQLVGELGSFLYKPPPAGRLRNALQHMWGYVDAESTTDSNSDPFSLLCRIQQLAVEQKKQYLLHSTALTELAFWSMSGS